MKVLVTGGTGTISSGIAKRCIQNEMEVYAITRGNQSFRNVEGVSYITADVWNREQVKKVLCDLTFDVVVECLVYDVAQLKTSLFNFGRLCSQYVFISTSGIYKRNLQNIRISEEDDKSFDEWDYTRNKIACEQYLMQHYSEYGFTYTIIRPVVTYGNYRIPFPVVTRCPSWTLFQRMLDNKPILACDNIKFSVIHIDDFSDAVVELFNNPVAVNEDFHIADVHGEIFWDDVINEAAKILKVEPLVIHVPVEAYKLLFKEVYDELKWNKTTPMLMDDSKLKKAVPAFEQKIFLDEGIKRIISAMYQEKIEQNFPLDTKWNLKCDMMIYYAYQKRIVSTPELRRLRLYYEFVPKSSIQKLKRAIWETKIREQIKNIKVLRTAYKKLKYW